MKAIREATVLPADLTGDRVVLESVSRGAAHHVSYWFGRNREYFTRKWGVAQPAGCREDVLARYYRHPFNNPEHPLSWFPENGNP